MGNKYYYNRKKYSVIILAILLFSFFSLMPEMAFDYNKAEILNQCYWDSQDSSVNETLYSQKSLQSATQTVLQRQTGFQKKIVGCSVQYIFSVIDLPIFFVLAISILSLYYFISNSSHRFVIHFIHNKDGQKA